MPPETADAAGRSGTRPCRFFACPHVCKVRETAKHGGSGRQRAPRWLSNFLRDGRVRATPEGLRERRMSACALLPVARDSFKNSLADERPQSKTDCGLSGLSDEQRCGAMPWKVKRWPAVVLPEPREGAPDASFARVQRDAQGCTRANRLPLAGLSGSAFLPYASFLETSRRMPAMMFTKMSVHTPKAVVLGLVPL